MILCEFLQRVELVAVFAVSAKSMSTARVRDRFALLSSAVLGVGT